MSYPTGEVLGARPRSDTSTRFCLWAPNAHHVELQLGDDLITLDDLGGGYFATTAGVGPGTHYRYQLDHGHAVADPASRCQPDGVHGPSEVVDLARYEWSDAAYRPRPLWDHVIYELHVGTFSPGGTFESALEQLDALVELGVTAVELMPIAQFPGERNWGYDGVFAYAVQNSYGGPYGLQRFVDVAHGKGLAVILDVVYNHLGPEGNVLATFGPYFNDHYQTIWGPALNFDDAESDEVREYYWQNARQWFEDFHVDGLRLDAVSSIVDTSSVTFIAELARRCADLSDRLGRPCDLIAETSANDPRTVTSLASGGLGMDAQWNDDFHHSLHVALTAERTGYYCDYDGASDLARAMDEGFVLQGTYSAFRRRRHGAPSGALSPEGFVVFAQNHDQVGNRPRGDRLVSLTGLAPARLAAAIVLLSPGVPLLFMGEEYGESAPFPYFVDHSDERLNESIRESRAREFPELATAGSLYDPVSPDTFDAARLDFSLRERGDHRALWNHYRQLIALRHSLPALRRSPLRHNARAWVEGNVITLVRSHDEGDVVAVFNLGAHDARTLLPGDRRWANLLENSNEEATSVELSPWAFSLYRSVHS
ncbi:MAG: maltooligosyl trehalose hydrolase [Acidimicrobiaceae bacterium]|nr:maltooligosyl trehalose hydrolase [Acidimicrobiaceae bacterium]